MADQDNSYLQQLQEEEIICNSLHLATISDHRPSSAKRPSPFSRSINQEPASKRVTPYSDPDLTAYKKIPLPPYIPAVSPPPLRRTLSEPIYTPAVGNPAAPPPRFSPNSLCPILQPHQESAPTLYRTVYDPNPSFNRPVAATAGTPPLPPGRRNSSRSPSSLESANLKRLKRMKERLKEMSQWANEVSNEDDQEGTVESENCCTLTDHKEECENEEAVYVEKSGDCLILHFKCPCGDEYQILLCGNNCYYKLTTFPNS